MVRRAPQIAVHRVQLRFVGQCLRRFVVDGCDAVAVCCADRFGDFTARKVHAYRVALHHGRRAVDVDHQPRQRIALAVNQPVARRRRVVGQSQRAAHAVGAGYAAVPPRLVDGLALEREYAHRDGAYLVVALGDEFARAGVDFDQRPFGEFLLFGLDVVDGARENPGVTAGQRFFLAFAQVYLRYHGCGFLSFGVRSRRS